MRTELITILAGSQLVDGDDSYRGDWIEMLHLSSTLVYMEIVIGLGFTRRLGTDILVHNSSFSKPQSTGS